MNPYSVFQSVSTEQLQALKVCLSGETRSFQRGEIIIRHTDRNENIGILHKGLVFLISISEDGETSIIDYYERGNIFGKGFTPDSDINLYYLTAKEDCEVTFFPYEKLMNCCEQNCEKHKSMISGIIFHSFRRCQMHIDILSCRSIRGKITAYLRYMRIQKESDSFELPISLSDLAGYLSVDRSAMMREIRKMKEEHLISAKGSHIQILSHL